jgi:hypothetical protein
MKKWCRLFMMILGPLIKTWFKQELKHLWQEWRKGSYLEELCFKYEYNSHLFLKYFSVRLRAKFQPIHCSYSQSTRVLRLRTVPVSVIHLFSAPFIKKIYYKASPINYIALKLRFAEPPPLCYAVYTYRKCYIINGCLIVNFFYEWSTI